MGAFVEKFRAYLAQGVRNVTELVVFLYELAHHTFAAVGWIISAFAVLQLAMDTGNQFIQLFWDTFEAVRNVILGPISWESVGAVVVLVLAFLWAWYRAGVVVTRAEHLLGKIKRSVAAGWRSGAQQDDVVQLAERRPDRLTARLKQVGSE